jgi:hypothetical protein
LSEENYLMPLLGKTLLRLVLISQFNSNTFEPFPFWMIKNIDKLSRIIRETLLVAI